MSNFISTLKKLTNIYLIHAYFELIFQKCSYEVFNNLIRNLTRNRYIKDKLLI